MQTQAGQQFNQRRRIAGIATRMSSAAFFLALLAWAPFSIANGSQDPSPAKSPPVATQADGARKNTADPPREPGIGPGAPTCAQLGTVGAARQMQRTVANGDLVGCGVNSNLA
jgi:hypothetical protein